MIQHLPAVLIIVGTLAIWAFYAMFARGRPCPGNQLHA